MSQSYQPAVPIYTINYPGNPYLSNITDQSYIHTQPGFSNPIYTSYSKPVELELSETPIQTNQPLIQNTSSNYGSYFFGLAIFMIILVIGIVMIVDK
jgi:hypothetical protein